MATLEDDNAVTCFEDDNAVTCWEDDNGNTLCCGGGGGTPDFRTVKGFVTQEI